MEGGPDTSDIRRSLAAAGFDPATYQPPAPIEVWPDCQKPLTVFLAMATQWNVGPSGRPSGLRYEALRELWPCVGVKKKERAQVFVDLQVMERAALDWFAERWPRD